MGKFRILIKGIVRHDGKFLAVERWYDDRIYEPYQWEFIDGEMEFGETPDQALERLVAEKTGLSVVTDKILYTWGFTAGETCSAGIAYLCEAASDEVMLSEDLRDYRWVIREEISQVITNPAVIQDVENAGLSNSINLDDFGLDDLDFHA